MVHHGLDTSAARREAARDAASRAVQLAPASFEARLAQEEIAKVGDKELAAFLEEQGRLRRVGDGYAVSVATYDRGRELLASLPEITLAAFQL